MRAMQALDAFVEVLDDEVLLLSLGLLDAGDVLNLAASSASLATRLAGAGETGRGGAVERLAAAQLGLGPVRVAVAAAVTSWLGGDATTSDEDGLRFRKSPGGPYAALRVLASCSPVAEALRRALLLRQTLGEVNSISEANRTGFGPASDAAKTFLDAFFKSEVRQRRRGPGVTTLAAADAALTALLVADDGGCGVMVASAEVVCETMRELDSFVEEGRPNAIHAAYEVVARRRSAVEFLRRRLEGAHDLACVGDVTTTKAKNALDVAVDELDETILGYTREGYDLACQRLANDVARCSVPYAHWWIFLGKFPYSQGWVVLR